MISALLKNQRLLVFAGGAFLVLFFILAGISLFDSTTILGIDRWIKPMKFSISIAIYLWTLAVYLHFLPSRERAVKIISGLTVLFMIGEIVLIVMQAARGTTSHFNQTSTFNEAVYAAMGLMIMSNTVLAIWLLVLYFRTEIDLPRSIVWGMRFGIILFLAAAFEGGYMAAQIGHSVGIADGGPGLPVINWSTRAGDLRVAHFVGMHAFQAVPLFAVLLERFRISYAANLTTAFAVGYLLFFSFTFIEALAGRPVLGL